MKTRISAIVCLLCVIGYAEVTRAEDPYNQRVADPYAISPDPPTMSSGTLEPYLSFMAGIAIPFSQDATFRNGDVESKVDYQMKQSVGGNAGIWFPTRNKMAGFDLGLEISGFVWYPDIACCRHGVNGTLNPDGSFEGTTTETQGIYVGTNVMLRYPMGISEAYPNGRWFPYIGVGGGAHQIAQRPGGFRGGGFANAIVDQRNTAPGFMALGGFKAHLFKYVAAFVEAKYVQAFHDELGTDRFGTSTSGGQDLVFDNYESTMRTIFVHGGLSIHFDVRP
jgi:hypothetical protein